MGGIEYWIVTIGAKTCCIGAAGCGGAANALTKRVGGLIVGAMLLS